MNGIFGCLSNWIKKVPWGVEQKPVATSSEEPFELDQNLWIFRVSSISFFSTTYAMLQRLLYFTARDDFYTNLPTIYGPRRRLQAGE